MATTSNTYSGNGSNKLFSVTFPYLDTSDIDVFLNGTLQTVTTQYFFANATTVEFVTAPANGATVLLSRSTDDAALQATFFPGSSIKAADLNYNFDQVLYLAQETANIAANQSTAGLQTQITTATNTANTAITTANAATATANGIAGTANTALSNSSAAVTTANAASVTANNAATTANAISATASSALSTANTAQTTANAALPKAGGTMTGVITYAAAQPRLVSGTAVASTSGTSIDFTGIPSWVKRVTVIYKSVSTNGASDIQLQIGSGSFTTSGYESGAIKTNNSGGFSTLGHTAGFLTESTVTSGATAFRNATLALTNISGNTWVHTGTMVTAGAESHISAGSIALGGTLDRVRITTVNGSDTFDAGSINILYQG
jgi:hypothetical protein